MAILNGYVKLPEGIPFAQEPYFYQKAACSCEKHQYLTHLNKAKAKKTAKPTSTWKTSQISMSKISISKPGTHNPAISSSAWNFASRSHRSPGYFGCSSPWSSPPGHGLRPGGRLSYSPAVAWSPGGRCPLDFHRGPTWGFRMQIFSWVFPWWFWGSTKLERIFTCFSHVFHGDFEWFWWWDAAENLGNLGENIRKLMKTCGKTLMNFMGCQIIGIKKQKMIKTEINIPKMCNVKSTLGKIQIK